MRWNERTGQEDILNGIWVDSFAGGGGALAKKDLLRKVK